MAELTDRIKNKIIKLNLGGRPAIFCVTGVNGAGKTRFTKALITHLPFYQAINMGLFTKTLQYFSRDLHFDAMGNISTSEKNELYQKFIRFVAQEYTKVGVNSIIEGVQIDPSQLSVDMHILGGVILETDDPVIMDRGDHPDSHFLRIMLPDDIHHRRYEINDKFFCVNNNNDFESAFNQCLIGLERLLDNALGQS